MADRTNALVESMITGTVETAVRITENFDRLFEKAEGDSKLLETLKSNYVNVINSLGNSLAEAAFRVSAATIRRIEELGFKAICYYVPVKLGDKIFLIDPIRIIDD
jgi:fatty acid/phospholipid biosynthesis enzyme